MIRFDIEVMWRTVPIETFIVLPSNILNSEMSSLAILFEERILERSLIEQKPKKKNDCKS